MAGFKMKRLGLIMQPEPGNPFEVEGVLNPAGVRGPDGQFYLFPRLVGKGNYSRIGIARVKFDEAGDPAGVERLGIALEPETDYELRPDGSGGCEDPRITYGKDLNRYVMTYTALSPRGPRIALALSEDLFHWQRLGLATFRPYEGIEFDGVDNKDASVFPVAIPDPDGKPAMAILHRPLFPGTRPEETVCNRRPASWISIERASGFPTVRWIRMDAEPYHLCHFTLHNRLASPVAPWEQLKIGGGTPPILTRHGWMVIYHGVHELAEPSVAAHKLCYSAGVLVLSQEHPRVIRYRSPEPVLTPELPQERIGTVANVVFPTAIDRRDDLGLPDRFDVYYGMADNRIGVARLDVPETLAARGTRRPAASQGLTSDRRSISNRESSESPDHDQRRFIANMTYSATIAPPELDELCVNTLRFLAVDAVQKAKSGHPGLPLGSAAMAYALWDRSLKFKPDDPLWPDRDRFVLSAGHGCALLYALLHVTGYDLPLEELERFRQWGSRTPGHPEYGKTPGVEATTGPLGKAWPTPSAWPSPRWPLRRASIGRATPIVDHYTYVLASDGDLEEGISSEAGSEAGHLRLGKLIVLYADNHITIEGSTELAFTEDRMARFAAFGWHVQRIENSNDIDEIADALEAARQETGRPSLIQVRTHIGFGSPHKQDTAAAHGEPLGVEEVRLTKEGLGWPVEPPFYIPEEALEHFREADRAGKRRACGMGDTSRGFCRGTP